MGRFFYLFMTVFFAFCGRGQAQESPPMYEAVMKIMAPLEYSGVPAMARPETNLSIDFNSRQWTLHNIHHYDSQGNIVLEEGHFGLCAELATFVFERLKPMLDSRYEVKFAMVGEPKFFAANQSNHIVLILFDKAARRAYLIDPSFHQYAAVQDLPEYQILNIQDTLSFVRDHSHDVFFSEDQAVPLYIKKDTLLTFAVTSVDGKFDKDNFMFVISANRRYKFTGRDIVVIGRRNREFEDYADRPLLNGLLTPQEINVLFDRIRTWIQEV